MGMGGIYFRIRQAICNLGEKEGDDKMSSSEYLAEVQELKRLDTLPVGKRLLGYVKFTGPTFMQAATTLGAGSFASACLMGAGHGYTMLWAPFYSYLSGMIMFWLTSRFTIYGKNGMDVITAQNKYHGKLIGSFATGFVACWMAYTTFAFGQYALGTNAIENLFGLYDISFPSQINWILLTVLSLPVALQYGKNDKMVHRVEGFIKILILLMLVTFGVVLFHTGIDLGAAVKGLLIPTLPAGVAGISLLIASMSGVMAPNDWVQLHFAQRNRHYGTAHRRLANFDMVFGGLLPVTLVLSFVGIAFAETFEGASYPEDTYELANALVSAVPTRFIQIGFYIGVIALIVSTLIGMSIIAAQSLCRAFNKPATPDSPLWKFGIIFTHISIGGAFFGKPMTLVVFVSGMQSMLNWITASSWYLLGNDKRYLGEHVVSKWWQNLLALLTVVLLNVIFATYVLTQAGVWV